MFLKIDREQLINKLNILGKVIDSKNINPIMSCVLIDLTEESLKLFVNSRSMVIESKIKNKYYEKIKEGKVLVKHRLLSEIIRKMESKVIEIELFEEKILRIYSDKFDSQINIMDIETFLLTNFEEKYENNFVVERNKLNDIIKKVSFSASVDIEKTTIYNGIFFEIKDKTLNAIATNSYRLSKISFPIDCDKNVSFILDSSIVKKIIETISINEIQFNLNKNNLCIETEEERIQIKLMIGNYPNIERILNKGYETKVRIGKETILKVIDRVNTINSVSLFPSITLDIQSDKIIVKTKKDEIGSSQEKMNDFNFNGKEVAITINTNYLIDAIKAIDDTEVELMFLGELKPMTIVGEKDKNNIQLIVPIRTN